MGLPFQAGYENPPIGDAVVCDALKLNLRLRSQELVLQIPLEAGIDRQGNDERGHARSHADDRDHRDDADHRLPALGAKITRRHEEFEVQARSSKPGIGSSGTRALYSPKRSPKRFSSSRSSSQIMSGNVTRVHTASSTKLSARPRMRLQPGSMERCPT